MTLGEARSIVGRVRYRDWRFFVDRIVHYKTDCPMDDCGCSDSVEGFALWIEYDSGPGVREKSRVWFIDPTSNPTQVVGTAFRAVLAAEEHTARERFAYRGALVFSPKMDVDKMAELAVGGVA